MIAPPAVHESIFEDGGITFRRVLGAVPRVAFCAQQARVGANASTPAAPDTIHFDRFPTVGTIFNFTKTSLPHAVATIARVSIP